MATYSDWEQRQLDIASGAEMDRRADRTERPLGFSKWLTEARRAAVYWYCLPDLPDTLPGDAEAAHGAGIDPYAYVEALGERWKLKKFHP
jgi:hypothetical protein